ncbi:MAG: zinc-ribbon domain-containing protein, partial [Clostridiales bacterium]|nr:zinc-ribbon domain-containing protein [Clostridiales bacterium]
MFCKNCGSNISDNATFCSGCGQKVEAEHPVVQAPPPEPVQEGPKFCPGCGRKQESSVKFCPECGYSAAQNTA